MPSRVGFWSLCFFMLLSGIRAGAAGALDVSLWPELPPGAVEGATPGKDDGTSRIWNVGVPGILVYRPDKPNGMVLIACPGGGYTHLTRLVGADGAVDEFLPKGVTIVALRYRTAPPSKDVHADTLDDGKRAVRLVRHYAKAWGIEVKQIGVLGWSAGANLALNVASHFDRGNPTAVDPIQRESSRPDFVVLLSPWPAKRVSADYPISADAPPAFIASALDDTVAPSTFARDIAKNYEKAGARHHLWIVEKGGHGAFTINAPGEGGQWMGRFREWVDALR